MQDTTITERDQRVIQHLQDSWKSLKEISPEALGDVSQFVTGLPNPYREAALNTIAQHVVSVMSLHMLSLMTTFQNTAEQDEISPEDCEEIFEQVLPDTFRILNKLNKHISVESFEDLVALSHITGSLQTLSKATSAEVAEGWMYELPSMYYRQVKREHLVAKDFDL
ncbi:MAG TPA: hypothetical protein VN207_06725 [Ktedonobacteraceae bacterium]|nr:hypothetical protein [Ktedonobacteraceae bacterium]